MSVSVTYASSITVAETLETNIASMSAANRVLTHSLFNSSASLVAGSSVPVTKVAAFEKALAAGVGTIDLTALTGSNGATVTFNGLKVQCAKFINKVGNTGAITIQEGAVNGYALGGAAFKWILQVGQELTLYGKEAAPDVAAADLAIDIAGTGTEVLQCILVAG